MSTAVMVFVESNTTGTGRLFAGAARRLGYRPVLLAERPERYPYAREDGIEVRQAPTADRESILAECRSFQAGPGLAGVTSSSEYFAAAAAAVARELGLPRGDADAIERCRNKHHQRLALARAGVGSPAFRAADTADKAAAAARELGAPVVVKPVSGSGSLGVRLCAGPEEAAAHAASLLAHARNERGQPMPRLVLVEECVEGPEFSVETFGERVIGVTQKHLGPPPSFVEVGHDFPAPIPPEAAEALARETRRALAALGLRWGPAHTEARLTPSGVKIIEVNARLAGGCIPELVRLATGVDLVAAAVALTAGRTPALEPSRADHASIRFLLPPGEGVLAGVDGLDEAGRMPDVAEVRLYAQTGDVMALHGDFRDRVGHVIAHAADAARARTAAETAAATVRWRIVGNKPEETN